MIDSLVAEAADAGKAAEIAPSRTAQIGEKLRAAISDPAVFRSLSERVVVSAQHFACDAVLGASRLGDQLAAGAVALANNGLHMLADGERPKRVLIVDGLLASGMQLSRATRQVRSQGASPYAAVVIALAEAPLPDSLEQLEVLT